MSASFCKKIPKEIKNGVHLQNKIVKGSLILLGKLNARYFFRKHPTKKQPPDVFYAKTCFCKFYKLYRKTPVAESLF